MIVQSKKPQPIMSQTTASQKFEIVLLLAITARQDYEFQIFVVRSTEIQNS